MFIMRIENNVSIIEKNKCKAKYFNKNVSKVTADMAVLFFYKSKRASLVTFKDTMEEHKFVFFQLEKEEIESFSLCVCIS